MILRRRKRKATTIGLAVAFVDGRYRIRTCDFFLVREDQPIPPLPENQG